MGVPQNGWMESVGTGEVPAGSGMGQARQRGIFNEATRTWTESGQGGCWASEEIQTQTRAGPAGVREACLSSRSPAPSVHRQKGGDSTSRHHAASSPLCTQQGVIALTWRPADRRRKSLASGVTPSRPIPSTVASLITGKLSVRLIPQPL